MDLIKRFKAFLNIEEPTNSILITKDKKGQWWFLGIYSNKFKDLDGEILSEASHKEYIQWLKDTGFKPVITAYHLPRAKNPMFWTKVFEAYENKPKMLQQIVDAFYKDIAFAKVERVILVNGFTFTLAKFLPGKEAVAEKLSTLKNLGMSHGFISKDSSANIFNIYRTFEMSVLRSVRAANPFTLSGALRQKGLGMVSKANDKALAPEDYGVLADLFGQEVIDKVVNDKTAKSEDILTRILEYKSKEAETAEEKAEEAEKAEEEAPTEEKQEEEAPAGLTVEAVAKATGDTFKAVEEAIIEMQKKISDLEAKNAALEAKVAENDKSVKQIKKSEDEKIAESWMPSFNWHGGYSPSQAKDNEVTEQEKEEISIAAPIGERSKVDPENPMNLGFWNILPSLGVTPNNEQ